MATRWSTNILGLILGLLLVSTSQAHFLWLVPLDQSGQRVSLYFSEGPEPDNPALLQKVASVEAVAYRSAKSFSSTPFRFSEDKSSLIAYFPGATAWKLNHTYGTYGKETKNLIQYTAASVVCERVGMEENDIVRLPNEGLVIQPKIDGKNLTVQVTKDGKPVAALAIDLQSANDHQSLVTNAEGIATAEVKPGVWGVRCLESTETGGSYAGVEYASVQHYTTVSFIVPDLSRAELVAESEQLLGDLPKAITSFGATKIGSTFYAFGGHTGGAHSYSNDEQFNQLIRLDTQGSKKWETISEGVRIQGNALVNDGTGVILVGGFSAENAKGEKSRFVSKAIVQKYDLQTSRWIDLPSLPEPRSSMDAIVLDGYLYAIGGWAMNGNSDATVWHKTAWRLPLSAPDKGWQAIAEPPFQRRAVAVATHANRIYVIGGMDDSGGTTTETVYYDPAKNTWVESGSIAGVPLNGFGAAAFEIKGKLIVSTVDGAVQQWNDDKNIWEIIGQVPQGRFFHRILPLGNDSFAMIGGANMAIGKFKETVVVRIKD